MLLHHSTGSRSSPDISLALASLAPHCEWRTLPDFGFDHLPIEIVLSLSPGRYPNNRPPKFNYKKARWDVYHSYIADHLPSLDADAVNIHQAARSFSLLLVEAAKASIPFGRLGRSPKPGGPKKRNLQCENDGGPTPRHTNLRLIASDTCRLYMYTCRDTCIHVEANLVGRPQSFLEPNSQPGKPPVLICLPVLILMLPSGFSMPSWAKRTPPKTLLFPVALPLLTLPTIMPRIFAHTNLKQHPVPRAEPNESS